MATEVFEKIEQNILRVEVLNTLRKAIVTGKLRPGEHLEEGALAAQLGVSRSPVREALRQLEEQGLVVSIPRHGSYVRDFDEKDIKEIFILRAALESLACELVLRENRLQDSDFAFLQDLIHQQEEAIKNGDFDRLTELDLQFHGFICQCTACQRLCKMWLSLRAQCELLFYQRFRAMPDYVPPTVIIDHSQILQALHQGNMELAVRLNREINERVMNECIQMLRSIKNQQPQLYSGDAEVVTNERIMSQRKFIKTCEKSCISS